jgi:uncharacterized protein (TIGR03435 family)
LVLATAVALAIPAMLAAQLPLPPGPPVDPDAQFEAASIKPYDASSGGAMMRLMPGQLDAVGIPTRLLLRQALRVQDYQIVGAPSWIDTDRYAIVAKAPVGMQMNAMGVMLANLLKDRFKLLTHTETRELPTFNLVLARQDGKLGPGLTPTSAECQAQISARAGGAGRGGPGPGPDPGRLGGPGRPGGPGGAPGRGLAPPPPPDFSAPSPCGMMRQGPGLTSASGQPIGQLVQMLSQLTGRPVTDKTGLTGLYDLNMKFTPDSGAANNPFGPPPPGAPPIAIDPDAPNLYTAVQEQLGLKLENARGPVTVTVIDRIEKPSLD